MIRESPAIPGLLMHTRPLNPKDDVMAKAIGAGLREWAANNYRSSDTPPTPSAPNATDRDDTSCAETADQIAGAFTTQGGRRNPARSV
jgi:hypothetical protein